MTKGHASRAETNLSLIGKPLFLDREEQIVRRETPFH